MKFNFEAWLVTTTLLSLWVFHTKADLVVHYKLDEPIGTTGINSVKDSVGLNHASPLPATHFGAPGATPNTGTSSISSNPGGSGSDVLFDTRLNPLSFTVTAWARRLGAHTNPLSSTGSYGSVVTNRYDPGGLSEPGQMSQGSNQNGFIIYNSPIGVWEFWTGDGPTGGTGWQVIDSGVTAPLGAWTHLAATYDHATTTKRFYINGVQMGGDQVTVVNPNYHAGFQIGSGRRFTDSDIDSGADRNFFFNGNIDDVAVYDTALNPSEIADIIFNGTPAHDAPASGIVPIINPSFEQVTFPGNLFNPSGQGMVNGWISNNLNDHSNVGAQANSPTASATPANFDAGIDGTHFLDIKGGDTRHIWQNTNHLMIEAATYELTVAVGRRHDHDDLNLDPALWQIALIHADDGSVAASLSGLTTHGEGGNLVDITLAYTATINDAGRELQVRLSNLNHPTSASSVSMDKVRVSYTVIPEPASIVVSLTLLHLMTCLRQNRLHFRIK